LLKQKKEKKRHGLQQQILVTLAARIPSVCFLATLADRIPSVSSPLPLASHLSVFPHMLDAGIDTFCSIFVFIG
jgi:hypothetical protein